MTKFGWDLPPGTTQRHIDEAFGGDQAPCKTCGRDPSDCDCPECPVCHETGNEYCYEQGHLTYTTAQTIGRTKIRIIELQRQLDDECEALQYLEEKQDDEDAKTVDFMASAGAVEPESDSAEDLGYSSISCIVCGEVEQFCSCDKFNLGMK